MTHNRLRGAGGDQNKKLFPGLVTGFGLLVISFSVGAQTLHLPWGPVTRLASPDGSKILYGISFQKGRNEGPSLWIEDRSTRKRTKLFDIGGTLSAAWSADSAAFYVNDFQGSDVADAYIYDAATLRRLNLDSRIQAADPESQRFAVGHTYYEVTHWVGNQEVAVRFYGHSDEPPVTDFDLRYRVSREGVVKKLSQHTRRVKD